MRTILFLQLLFIASVGFGQNLIPNGDFEKKRGRRYTHRPWRFINTVDRFVLDGDTRRPYGTEDWQLPQPQSGNVYVGIRVYAKYREFLQLRLTDDLEKGERYLFEMYVHPSERYNSYLRSIGASFYHRRPYYTSEYYIYKNPPQVEEYRHEGIFAADTAQNGWVRVSGTFRSNGTEKYISVGNFSKKRIRDKFKKKKWYVPDYWKFKAYYFIDNVALYKIRDEEPKDKEDLQPLALIDTTVHIPDTIPYSIEDENYIYTIDEKRELVLENIRFEFGSDELIPTSYRDLELVLEYLNANREVRLKIVGHTDNVGDKRDNMRLSIKRAKRVYDYFTDNQIRSDRLEYEGKGESDPLHLNSTRQNRSKNRRVEILLLE